MHIGAVASNGAWHPLTGVIDWDDSYWRASPIFAPTIESDPLIQSTIAHEIVHKWCARLGRFSLLLRALGAQPMAAWLQNPSAELDLPAPLATALGALHPLLEGAAMFGQIDYRPLENPDLCPNPLSRQADFVQEMTTDEYFDSLRRAAHDTPLANSRTTLQLLFHGRSGRYAPYFAGYIYMKALQRLCAAHDPDLAHPAWFLPVALRLIFDHPVLEHAAAGSIDPVRVISSIHSSLSRAFGPGAPSLGRFVRNNSPSVWETIHWDVHAQLEDGVWGAPLEHHGAGRKIWEAAIAPGAIEASNLIVGLAETFQVSACTGVLESVEPDGRFCIRTPEAQRIGQVVLTHTLLYASGAVDRTTANELRSLGVRFIETMKKAVGRKVSLALVLVFATGEMHLVLWIDEKFSCIYPLDPPRMGSANMISYAARLAPETKRLLQTTAPSAEMFSESSRCATSEILALLTSNSSRRALTVSIDHGPASILPLAEGRLLADACSWATSPQTLPHLGRLDAAWRKIFDLPGFAALKTPLGFTDFFPVDLSNLPPSA